jgi:C4-type Zn-finger protein
MNAVAPRLEGQVRAIIEQKSDAAALDHRAQHVDRTADPVIIEILQAQLQAGDVTAIEGLLQKLGEAGQVINLRRRDQIETAGGNGEGSRSK